ncbi:uncharacterized protein EAF02_001723 [Botrytis sinoallii]|uniref:uncharacterized protein n=1 Tax=Botrytis sinoallii TaxID=1463999 RepID=UPI0019004F4B|nr:uncharacterized protein EAF02_001723 [Botrytis sinoallii]KAF7891398.1 hypothetical protein EAF02_001723 [Botrytis sinoallii]
MNSETLVERGSEEILNTNQPSNNINNAWRQSFAGGKAVNPKFFESRYFPSNEPTIHRQPQGGPRERHPCSPQENGHNYSQNPFQAVSRSPKGPIVQSPLPENYPGASQSPLQAVTASSIVQRKSSLENGLMASPDYADPRRVPGTDKNIYPRAPIRSEFQERYPQLVDFFKQAVDTHKVLKYHTSKINYELRLCGSTPANAVASVIIFCAEALFKCLRSLLGSRHIQRQYQLVNSSFQDRFQLAPSKPHPQVSAPIVVPFNVVYWREANTPTQRKSAMEQVVTRNRLLISMDSKLYGLTVDHLFKDQQGEEQSTIANEAEVLYDEDDSEDSEPEWSWIDDVKYEDFENVEFVSDAESVSSGGSHAKTTIDHGPTEQYGESISGHKVDILSVIDTTTTNLDWALIEFDNGYYERPNAFYSKDDPANPKFFRTLSAIPKTSDVNVFMISGVSGTRRGVMLNNTSYIGGKPNEDLCQAWNVILSDSDCVIDGDCGSLIVDQNSLEVYGHVVASNPFGEAYVVPLQDTFQQISNSLEAKDLSLPNPRVLMERLVAHYSKEGDSGVADKAKQILASMEEPEVERPCLMCDQSDQKDVLLSCNGCNASYHTHCIDLDNILGCYWYCMECVESGAFGQYDKSQGPVRGSKSPSDSLGEQDQRLHSSSNSTIQSGTSSELPNPSLSANDQTTFLPQSNIVLPCEFIWNDCGVTFNSEDFENWFAHSLTHFKNLPPPSKCFCLFCDKEFEDIDNSYKNWRNRMIHSRDHFLDGKTNIQPDFLVIEYMWKNNLIDEADYTLTKQYIEYPSISNLILKGFETPESKSPIENHPDEGALTDLGPSVSNQQEIPHIPYQPHNLPQVKPAEQNPPCSTLFVGNLPRDTSEEELMAMFSKQKGFGRLYFTSGPNPLMCFVEFEDVSFATKCIQDFNGMSLQNSTKGNIRLRFSRIPVHVRSGPFLEAEEVIPFLPSHHHDHRESSGTSWSAWEWDNDRKQWQSHRTDSMGKTEWKFEGDQPTSTSSVTANMSDYDPIISPSAPNYEESRYNVASSSLKQSEGYSGTEQPVSTKDPPTQYPPTQYPPSQDRRSKYLPDSTVNTTVHSSVKSRKF